MRKSQNLDLFCESISIFLSCSLFFLCLSCLLAVLLLTLSSLFYMELWLANFLGKGQIILQRVVCKQWNWQWIFPQSVTFFSECNSDKSYHWKDLSLKLLLFINLYPAIRGPSIFLDKSGRLKRSVAWQDNVERIEFRNTKTKSWVLRNQHFLYSPLERISGNNLFLEKHKNNHSHIHWMYRPTELASTTWAKLSLSF